MDQTVPRTRQVQTGVLRRDKKTASTMMLKDNNGRVGSDLTLTNLPLGGSQSTEPGSEVRGRSPSSFLPSSFSHYSPFGVSSGL